MAHSAKAGCLAACQVLVAFVVGEATCRLPINLPPTAIPSGATIGPDGGLVIADLRGSVFFADLKDFSVREDAALLGDADLKADGPLYIRGLTMTSPESSFLYLGSTSMSVIFEYEWHKSRRVSRRFYLPEFEGAPRTIQSLLWVPTEASMHGGYFHVGSGQSGEVFVYELPLLQAGGSRVSAELVGSWAPAGTGHISGLAFSSNLIFVARGNGQLASILTYEARSDGLAGPLQDQFGADVGAEGLAVRRMPSKQWEVILAGTTPRSIFAYIFQPVTGLELQGGCAAFTKDPREAKQSTADEAEPRDHRELFHAFLFVLLLLCLFCAGSICLARAATRSWAMTS